MGEPQRREQRLLHVVSVETHPLVEHRVVVALSSRLTVRVQIVELHRQIIQAHSLRDRRLDSTTQPTQSDYSVARLCHVRVTLRLPAQARNAGGPQISDHLSRLPVHQSGATGEAAVQQPHIGQHPRNGSLLGDEIRLELSFPCRNQRHRNHTLGDRCIERVRPGGTSGCRRKHHLPARRDPRCCHPVRSCRGIQPLLCLQRYPGNIEAPVSQSILVQHRVLDKGTELLHRTLDTVLPVVGQVEVPCRLRKGTLRVQEVQQVSERRIEIAALEVLAEHELRYRHSLRLMGGVGLDESGSRRIHQRIPHCLLGLEMRVQHRHRQNTVTRIQKRQDHLCRPRSLRQHGTVTDEEVLDLQLPLVDLVLRCRPVDRQRRTEPGETRAVKQSIQPSLQAS